MGFNLGDQAFPARARALIDRIFAVPAPGRLLFLYSSIWYLSGLWLYSTSPNLFRVRGSTRRKRDETNLSTEPAQARE
jgi:hypothetical protein